MKKIFVLLTYCFFITGCISEFYPNIKDVNSEYLIIDAKISNKEGAQVKLTTITIGGTKSHPLSMDANVEINDNTGGKIVLSKTSQGVYYSSTNGIPTRAYTLSIKTADGNEFTSSSEIMYPETPIDSIYGAFEFHSGFNSTEEKPGVALYLDFNTSINENKFFRWTYNETWIEKTPYVWHAYGTFDKSGSLLAIVFWPYDTEHNRKCFHYYSSNEVLIKNTEQLKPGLMKGNSIFFVDDLSKRFSIGYSAEIKQYSITSNAYLYYSQLQKNNELSGSLYDPIPSFIESNIYNINDPLQKVTGYFVVSSVASKRIFFKPADIIPVNYLPGGAPFDCQDSTASTFSVASRIHRNDYSLNIYNYVPPGQGAPMTIYMANSECFDCTATGGSVQKPSYWDDRYSGN